MKPFRFQQFSVHQNEKVFRVGTDAVLLGALCTCADARNVLEVGCGTGIVSLMVAQRNTSAEIFAIDISPEAVKLASENFSTSVFSGRLTCREADYRHLQTSEKYDLIISNPPYFEKNASSKDVLARQHVELNFHHLIHQSAKLLAALGLFSVIIPSDAAEHFSRLCEEVGLKISRKVTVFGIEGGAVKRNILEFCFSPKNLVKEDFVIEKSPRKYSDQYLELTREFHVFGN